MNPIVFFFKSSRPATWLFSMGTGLMLVFGAGFLPVTRGQDDGSSPVIVPIYYWDEVNGIDHGISGGPICADTAPESVLGDDRPACFGGNVDHSIFGWEDRWVEIIPPLPPENPDDPGPEPGPTDETTTEHAAAWCPGLGTFAYLRPGPDPDPDDQEPEDEIPIDCGTSRIWQMRTFEVEYVCVEEYPGGDCGSCGEGESCELTPATGSILVDFKLGADKLGRTLGVLRLHQRKPSPLNYTPTVLQPVLSGTGGAVLRNEQHQIRQVVGATRLTDVRVLGDAHFEVRYFARPKTLERDPQGFVVLPDASERRIEVLRPAGATGDDRLLVRDTFAGKSREFLYSWNTQSAEWTLSQQGATSAVTVSESVDPKSGDLVKTERQLDADGNELHRSRTIFHQFPFGLVQVAREEIVGDETRRSDYSYYEDPADSARLGKYKSRVNPDGSWLYLGYDDHGIEKYKIEPWQDSPLTHDPDQAKATWYSYRALTPDEDHYHPDARIAEAQVRVLGIPVSKTLTLNTLAHDRGRIRVEEICADPVDGSYGAPGNLRSVTRYYPQSRDRDDPTSGKLHSRLSPDGQLTRYAYRRGAWLGDFGIPDEFTPDNDNGSHLRTLQITTPTARPNGIAGRTTLSLGIADARGNTVYQQSLLLSDALEGELDLLTTVEEQNDKWQELTWTGHGFDEKGRRVISRDHTGITGEYRYNECCNKIEWQRDANGVETHIIYDPLQRVAHRIVKVPGANGPDDDEGRRITTTSYSYDAAGNTIETRVKAGDLVQTTKSEYDGFGRVVESTAADGLITRYKSDIADRRSTTILPNGATRIDERYLDGRAKSSTGTATIAQYSDYGVATTDGAHLQWNHSTQVRPDGPRWTRSYTNALGQSIRSEQPGFTDPDIENAEDILLTQIQHYDEFGRPVHTATYLAAATTPGGAATFPESQMIGAPSITVYDPVTGDVTLAGQDRNRDGTLDPSDFAKPQQPGAAAPTDQASHSESRFENIDGDWYQVTRSYTHSATDPGKPRLVSESRHRITGLAAQHPDYGTLVSESISLVPVARDQKPAASQPSVSSKNSAVRNPAAEPQPSQDIGGNQRPSAVQPPAPTTFHRTLSRGYRHRDIATTTTVTTGPTGLDTIQIAHGGLVQTVSQSLPREEANPKTLTTRYRYDPLGRQLAISDPRTGTSKTEYHPTTGRIVATIDPEQRRTKYAYYTENGNPGAGQLKTQTNPAGHQQHLAYDLQGRQLATWGDSNYPLAYRYNAYGELVTLHTFQNHTDPNTNPQHLIGRAPPESANDKDPKSKIHDPKSSATQWRYHQATGLLLRKEYADGKGTDYRYTPAGQLRTRTWARSDGNADAPLRLQTHYHYDPFTAQLQRVAYPASGSQAATEVSYTHDHEGRVHRITDATGTRTFTYTTDNQIETEQVTLAENGLSYTLTRSYDNYGRPHQVQLAAPPLDDDVRPSVPAVPVDDPVERNSSSVPQDDSSEDEPQVISANQRASAVPLPELSHRVTYQWDDLSRLRSVTSLAGRFEYGYTDQGNPALLTAVSTPAHQVSYDYEPQRNLLTEVRNSLHPAPLHPAQKAGTTAPTDRPQTDPTAGSPTPPISRYQYRNDDLGRRDHINVSGSAFLRNKDEGVRLSHLNGTEGYTMDIAYNTRSEVTGVQYHQGAGSFGDESYHYDSIGNRNGFAVTDDRGQKSEVSYQSNVLNQYTEVRGQNSELKNQRPSAPISGPPTPTLDQPVKRNSVPLDGPPEDVDGPIAGKDSALSLHPSAFDPDGNLTEDQNYRYTWNAENRLVRAERKDATHHVTYSYDFQGRRTTKTLTAAEQSQTTQYIYDNWNLLAEITTLDDPKSKMQNLRSPDKVRYYTWGRDLSGSLQGAGGVGGLLAISEPVTSASSRSTVDEPILDDPTKNQQQKTSNTDKNAAHFYPTYDANGNIVQMLGRGGTVLAHYEYDAFGKTRIVGGSDKAFASTNTWRFSTKPQEEGTGFYYYGFRYYMPETGRWASRDPIEEEGGNNLYAFVGNFGIGTYDKLGMESGGSNTKSSPTNQEICDCLEFYIFDNGHTFDGVSDEDSGATSTKYELPAEGGLLPVKSKTPPKKFGIFKVSRVQYYWMISSRWKNSDECKICAGGNHGLVLTVLQTTPNDTNGGYTTPSIQIENIRLAGGGTYFKLPATAFMSEIPYPGNSPLKLARFPMSRKVQTIEGDKYFPYKYKIIIEIGDHDDEIRCIERNITLSYGTKSPPLKQLPPPK